MVDSSKFAWREQSPIAHARQHRWEVFYIIVEERAIFYKKINNYERLLLPEHMNVWICTSAKMNTTLNSAVFDTHFKKFETIFFIHSLKFC